MEFQIGDLVTFKEPAVLWPEVADTSFKAVVVEIYDRSILFTTLSVSNELMSKFGWCLGSTYQVFDNELTLVSQPGSQPGSTHYCPRCTYTEVSSAVEICKWCR